jgi:hypothetical protein
MASSMNGLVQCALFIKLAAKQRADNQKKDAKHGGSEHEG